MKDSGSPSGYTSHDCVDVYYDGPGDTTVRPLTGKLLELAKAQRALIEESKRRSSASQDVGDGERGGPS